MTKETINQYYQRIYTKNPSLANSKEEQIVRAFVESYFRLKSKTA